MLLARVRAGVSTLALSILSIVPLVGVAGCGGEKPPSAPTTARPDPPAATTPSFSNEAWGKFHSARFRLTLSLPDGKTWKIDDHRAPELVAVHAATSSRLTLLTTEEEELMNRDRCEERARKLGWVNESPRAPFTTVAEETLLGPDAYDSRVWVAIDARAPGGAITGHVYMFGAFLRRCLLVHFESQVPSARDEEILASRLALVRGRLVKRLTLDPLRTTDDATVPKSGRP